MLNVVKLTYLLPQKLLRKIAKKEVFANPG